MFDAIRNIVNMLEVDIALWLCMRMSSFFADHAKGTKDYTLTIIRSGWCDI